MTNSWFPNKVMIDTAEAGHTVEAGQNQEVANAEC